MCMPHTAGQERQEAQTWHDYPEMAIMEAMGAYDNFGRRIVMQNRGLLTKSQADVVVGLYLFGTMNMTQVSEHLAVSKEQATRAVAPLVERGFVRRSRNASNHRVVEISLTEAGREHFEKTQSVLIADVAARLDTLSEADREKLIRASREAVEVLRKL